MRRLPAVALAAGALLLLGLLVLLLTPAGTWVLGRLAVQLAPRWGWNVVVGAVDGAPLLKPTFRQVVATNDSARIRVAVARLALSPWTYSVAATSPQVRLTLKPKAGDAESGTAGAPPPRLPVERLPQLTLRGGRLTVLSPRDSLRLVVQGVTLRYLPDEGSTEGEEVDVARGVLTLQADAWRLARPRGEVAHGHLRVRASLEPHRLTLDDVMLSVAAGTRRVGLEARGALDLATALPAQLQAEVEVGGEAGDACLLSLVAEGTLVPLAVEVSASGAGTHRRLGPVALETAVTCTPEEITIDRAVARVAGGQVRMVGAYLPKRDSLQAEVVWQNVQLVQLPGVSARGELEGTLRADGKPAQRRFAASLSAGVRGLDALPGAPLDVEVEGSLDRSGRLAASMRSEAGDLAAAGAMNVGGPYELELTGSLRPSRILGRDLAQVHLVGRAVRDTVDVHLKTARLPGGIAGLSPVELSMRLTGGRHLEGELSLAGRAVTVQGQADLKAARLDTATAAAAALDLSRLGAGLAGTVSGRLGGAGTLRPPDLRATGDLEFEELAVAGWRLGPARVELSYGNRDLRGTVRGEGLTATAILDSSMGLDARVELDRASIHRNSVKAGGAATALTLTGTAAVRGSLRDLAGLEVDVDLADLDLSQGDWWARAEAGLVASHSQGRGVLKPARLRTSLGAAHVSGWTRGDSLWLEARIDSLELAAVHADLTGPGTLVVEVGGTVRGPEVSARLQAPELRMAGQLMGHLGAELEVGESLELRARLDQGAHLEETAAADSGLALHLSMPLAGLRQAEGARARLRAEARHLQVGSLVYWLLADSASGVLDGACRLEVPAAARGYDWAALEGEITIERAELAKADFRARLRRPASARLRAGEVEISEVAVPLEIYRRDLEGFATAGQAVASGGLGGSRVLLVRVDSVDLAAVERMPGLGRRALPDGALWGTVALSGETTARRYDLAARLHLDQYGEVTGQAALADGGAAASATWRTPLGDSLAAELKVRPRRDDGGLDWGAGLVRLRTRHLDAAVFLELLPQLESLRGPISGEVEISGLGPGPQLFGRLDVGSMSFALLDVKPEYSLPPGAIVFSGGRGQLEGFSGPGRRGRGRMELGGYVDLASSAAPQYRILLEFEDLPYRYDTVFDAPDVDGRLTLSKAGDEVLLEGDVRLTGAQAEAPLVDLTAPPVPPPPAVQSPYLESMRLDVFVDVRDLGVHNELADLTVEGSTRVYGTFYKPRFQGEMAITEGQVIVLNSEFTFTKGTLVLDQLVPTYSILDLAYDPLLLNPELDLEATTRVTPIDPGEDVREVTMTVQGPAQQVAPRFTSEGLGDTEIISLLAFGSIQPAGRDDALDALYTAAGQLVLSRGATRVGLDEFQLLPRSTVLTKEKGRALRLGKHLTFPVPFWVRYEALAMYPAIGQVRLEYDITSYAKLKAMAQSKYQVYGLGIGFRREF